MLLGDNKLNSFSSSSNLSGQYDLTRKGAHEAEDETIKNEFSTADTRLSNSLTTAYEGRRLNGVFLGSLKAVARKHVFTIFLFIGNYVKREIRNRFFENPWSSLLGITSSLRSSREEGFVNTNKTSLEVKPGVVLVRMNAGNKGQFSGIKCCIGDWVAIPDDQCNRFYLDR